MAPNSLKIFSLLTIGVNQRLRGQTNEQWKSNLGCLMRCSISPCPADSSVSQQPDLKTPLLKAQNFKGNIIIPIV